jgi:hypothetical protein
MNSDQTRRELNERKGELVAATNMDICSTELAEGLKDEALKLWITLIHGQTVTWSATTTVSSCQMTYLATKIAYSRG